MASEELASFLYNLVCRFSVSCISVEFLYLSGLSCVYFFPSKSGELKDFIPSKICGIKSLRMLPAPAHYIRWQPWDSSRQSSDNKIWNFVEEIRRDGIGGTCIIFVQPCLQRFGVMYHF